MPVVWRVPAGRTPPRRAPALVQILETTVARCAYDRASGGFSGSGGANAPRPLAADAIILATGFDHVDALIPGRTGTASFPWSPRAKRWSGGCAGRARSLRRPRGGEGRLIQCGLEGLHGQGYCSQACCRCRAAGAPAQSAQPRAAGVGVQDGHPKRRAAISPPLAGRRKRRHPLRGRPPAAGAPPEAPAPRRSSMTTSSAGRPRKIRPGGAVRRCSPARTHHKVRRLGHQPRRYGLCGGR